MVSLPELTPLGTVPLRHPADLELGLALGVMSVGVAYPCRFPLTLTPVHIAQRPSQTLTLNLQGDKLGGAVATHDDQPGDVLVCLP